MQHLEAIPRYRYGFLCGVQIAPGACTRQDAGIDVLRPTVILSHDVVVIDIVARWEKERHAGLGVLHQRDPRLLAHRGKFHQMRLNLGNGMAES